MSFRYIFDKKSFIPSAGQMQSDTGVLTPVTTQLRLSKIDLDGKKIALLSNTHIIEVNPRNISQGTIAFTISLFEDNSTYYRIVASAITGLLHLQWFEFQNMEFLVSIKSVGSGVPISDLHSLTDVTLGSLPLVNNHILQYNSTTSQWENKAPPAGDLNSLTDVTIGGIALANNQIIQYNSGTSQWENKPIPLPTNYSCYVVSAVSQTLTGNNTPLVPTFPNVIYNNGGLWDVGTGRMVAPVDGIYAFVFTYQIVLPCPTNVDVNLANANTRTNPNVLANSDNQLIQTISGFMRILATGTHIPIITILQPAATDITLLNCIFQAYIVRQI